MSVIHPSTSDINSRCYVALNPINWPPDTPHVNRRHFESGRNWQLRPPVVPRVLVWIKLRKEYLGLSRNVIIGCVYVVPENSTHVEQDVFNILENEIACIAADHETLICSDYNGRTGRIPDFATYFMSGNDENLPYRLPDDNLTSDHEIRCMFEQGMLTRFSEDSQF